MVENKIKKLKVNKSPGPDKIHPRVLHETASTISTPLCLLFRNSLFLKQLPEEWKHANVTAIFKKGNKNLPQNYRPVSLTSIVCKLMESILRDAIVKHMKLNGLFSPQQFGFIEGKSTTLQLLSVLDIWTEILDQGGSLDAVYCDFMKAFDKVPHNRLMHKIDRYGIKGNVYEWIKSFLSNRKQWVKVNDCKSSTAPVTSGIPQGSVLGPILFVIYINDLPSVVNPESHVYLFADDTKIFRHIKSTEDHKQLQNDLDNLVKWSNIWLLKFHPDKCITINVGKNNPNYKYFMEGTCLKRSEAEKDIGIFVDENLNFDKHINYIVKKANRVLGITKRTFEHINAETFVYIYKGLVRPNLEYASSVWSPHSIKHKKLIESVQKRATKIVPGLSKLAYSDRLKTLNLPTLAYRRVRGDMILVHKILNNEDNPCPNLFNFNNNNLRGHNRKLFLPNCNRDLRKYYFSNRIIQLWNSLPNDVVNSKDTLSFEKSLDHLWKDQELKYEDYKSYIK